MYDRTQFPTTLMLLASIACLGCNRDDGDKLAKIGRLTAQKAGQLAPARTPFDDLIPDTSRAARVRARLRLDASLADLSIQVRDEADGIHLIGQVPHPDHAEWAVRLARETVGVSNVVSELTIGSP